ncbi:MAG: tetratricopeptide repeat protein [Acidimicrobiales bacterium]
MDVELRPPGSSSRPAADPGRDRAEAVAALEKRLAATSRAVNPYVHAGLAYRLGLAYTEATTGSGTESLRKALACFDVAASIFDPRYDPVPHARVLNAAGAAHRALGDRRRAAGFFERSAELLAGHDRDEERAAAFNNLGLVRNELGQTDLAVAACDEALALFTGSTPDALRGKAAALHTRGMARAAEGTPDGLSAALADYREALSAVALTEAPFHFATLQQAIGVADVALAALQPERADRLLFDAVGAVSEALTVFTRAGFPYQYALCKNNLGTALMRRAALQPGAEGAQGLRWAMASFEETVAVLDPRMYSKEWQVGYANLEQAQSALSERGLDRTRVEHFAALVACADGDLRTSLLRERLSRLLMLPEATRRSALEELARATSSLNYDEARAVIHAEISVLMELPTEDLQAGLEARYAAHGTLPPEARETADMALDQAVGDALGGPQRMYVRDFLYGLGWERPG